MSPQNASSGHDGEELIVADPLPVVRWSKPQNPDLQTIEGYITSLPAQNPRYKPWRKAQAKRAQQDEAWKEANNYVAAKGTEPDWTKFPHVKGGNVKNALQNLAADIAKNPPHVPEQEVLKLVCEAQTKELDSVDDEIGGRARSPRVGGDRHRRTR
jgi:hypothetical protein